MKAGNNTAVSDTRTWYGITAKVSISANGLHQVAVGALTLPHPPVINYLLRHGLPDSSTTRLAVAHEIGHLQALPFELIYGALIITLAVWSNVSSWFDISLIVLGIFASWELLAEAKVILQMGNQYTLIYQRVPAWPRMIFWTLIPVLILLGWHVLLPGLHYSSVPTPSQPIIMLPG